MTVQNAPKSTLIVGAGIGGLAAACVLARQGMQVTVLEQSDVLGEIGAGLQLSPNAMAAVQSLGVADQVLAQGFAPENAGIRHGVTGANLMTLPLKRECEIRFGNPYIHIHRADLHDILRQQAKDLGVTLKLNAPVAGYTPHPQPTVHLKDGSTRSADLIIGSDGVRSSIAAQMHPNHPPEFTGQVAWRGLLPAQDLPKGTIAPDATVWIGKDAHIVTYYVRGGEMVNFVAVQERDDWQDASWRREGDIHELRAAFSGWHKTLETLVNATQTAHLWALFGRPELPHWSDGAVTLLGDACHPTLPFMAQGAAMALEDAVVLGKCLQTNGTVASALARYEAMRKPRTSMLQAKARANANLFHKDTLVNRAKLTIAGSLPTGLGYAPLKAVYKYDPRTAR